ncbi:MAG: hypothetical protein HYX97_04005 [Chloroflexi bacterium]|nr:hypothetical protein [Chloroflexota bacterium]
MSDDVPATKKGVVLIHGMGRQSKNDMLLRATNAITSYLSLWGDASKVTIERGLKDESTKERSRITVRYADQEWVFVEAWWAKSFEEPKLEPMLGWTALRFTKHAGALVVDMVTRQFSKAFLTVLTAIVYLSVVIVPLFWGSSGGYFGSGTDDLLVRAVTSFLGGFFLIIFATRSTQGRQLADMVFEAARKQVGDSAVLARQWLRYSKSHVRRGQDRLFWLVFLELVYHFFASPLIAVLYGLGILALVPAMLLVRTLSLAQPIAGLNKVTGAVSNWITAKASSFIVQSLGDIKVYVYEPVQAQAIRDEVEGAIDELSWDMDAVYLVGHSTGATIGHEVLALPSNAERVSKVAKLLTFGSVVNMVSAMPHKRNTLHSKIECARPGQPDRQWVNIWTRYDPARPGPVEQKAALISNTDCLLEAPVTNEDHFLTDHASYLNNEQAVGRIVAEIWDKPDSPFGWSEEMEEKLTRSRKAKVLPLYFPRLILWYLFFTLFAVFIPKTKAAQEVYAFFRIEDVLDKKNKFASAVEGVLISPDAAWERVLAAVGAAFIIWACFYLVYGLFENLWRSLTARVGS